MGIDVLAMAGAKPSLLTKVEFVTGIWPDEKRCEYEDRYKTELQVCVNQFFSRVGSAQELDKPVATTFINELWDWVNPGQVNRIEIAIEHPFLDCKLHIDMTRCETVCKSSVTYHKNGMKCQHVQSVRSRNGHDVRTLDRCLKEYLQMVSYVSVLHAKSSGKGWLASWFGKLPRLF